MARGNGYWTKNNWNKTIDFMMSYYSQLSLRIRLSQYFSLESGTYLLRRPWNLKYWRTVYAKIPNCDSHVSIQTPFAAFQSRYTDKSSLWYFATKSTKWKPLQIPRSTGLSGDWKCGLLYASTEEMFYKSVLSSFMSKEAKLASCVICMSAPSL